MKILESLTRARQFCDHPSLLSTKANKVYARDQMNEFFQKKEQTLKLEQKKFEEEDNEKDYPKEDDDLEKEKRKIKTQEKYIKTLQE